ncbi:hypothetical protein ACM8C1_004694, partial [Vibrio parahaemolyticus]
QKFNQVKLAPVILGEYLILKIETLCIGGDMAQRAKVKEKSQFLLQRANKLLNEADKELARLERLIKESQEKRLH